MLVESLLLSFLFGIIGNELSEAVDRRRLITSLLANYNNLERPAPMGIPVNITMHLEMQSFVFRERDGAFSMLGLLDMTWHDHRLKWDTSEFGNVTAITVNQRSLWIPDLELYHSAPDKFLRTHRNGVVIVKYDGVVIWTDNIDVVTFCNSDMHNWPHDSHFCTLRFGSWTHNGFEMDIKQSTRHSKKAYSDIHLENENPIYKVVNYTSGHLTAMYDCCAEPYFSMDYHFTLVRRSSFAILFRAQAICVVILSLLALSMQAGRSEKIVLNGIAFIVVALNLLYFAGKIGQFARSVPVIVTFYGGAMTLIAFGHIISVFGMLSIRSRYSGKLPRWVSSFLKSAFAQSIYATQRKHSSLDQENAEGNAQFEDVKLQEFSTLIGPVGFHSEWLQLATVVERITLMVFSVLYLILGTIYYF